MICAVIGFTSLLIKEPTRLLQMLLFSALIVGIFFAVYHFLIKNKSSDSNYERAVKQSKKRQKKKQKTRVKAPHLRVVGSNPHKLRKEKPLMVKNEKHHLTVIEGRKNKKKNRALF